jgi:hypothetical protein
VHDGDALRAHRLHRILGEEQTLGVIAAAGPEEVRPLLVHGQADGRAAIPHADHLALLVDVGGGLGDRRPVAADDGHHFLGNRLLCCYGAVLRVRAVVHDGDFNLTAQDAASIVDEFLCHFDRLFRHLTFVRIVTSDGGLQRNLDGSSLARVLFGAPREDEYRCKHTDQQNRYGLSHSLTSQFSRKCTA